jgi:signal transduction histidine kinase/PAS domain-containing protein
MAHPGLPAALWNQDGADDLSALLGVGFGTGAAALLLRDDDLIIVTANSRAEQMLAGAGRSLCGRSVAEFGAALDVTAFRRGGVDALRGEQELITSSGDRVVAELFADRVTSPSGRRYVLLHLVEVTDLRRAERELADSDRCYRLLAGSLPEISVVIFDHDLRVQLAVGEALLHNGYDPDGLTGRLLVDISPAKLFADLEGPFREALAGRGTDLEKVSPTNGRRFRIRTRPMADPSGSVVAGLAVTEDVSADRIRQSKLEQIHRFSRLGSCWFDRRSGWTFDDELLELWGVESATNPSELIDRQVLPDDRVAVQAARERCLTMGGRSSVSYRVQHGKSGRELRFQCTFESVVDPDGVMVTATATHVDVTDSVVTPEILELVSAEAAADQRSMLLRRVSDALAAAYSGPHGPLHSIADLAAADLNAAVVLRVLTPDQRSVELDVTSHWDGQLRAELSRVMAISRQFAEPGPIRDQVIRQGKIISSVGQRPTMRNHDRFNDQTGWRIEHSITAPIRHNGLVLGQFSVIRTGRGAPFETGDEHLVQVLADRAGSVVAEHRVEQLVERQAEERLAQLTERQRELLAELAGMETRERSQIAESIHDEPIQLIVAAAMRIDSLRDAAPGGDDELNRLARLLESSVDWLRNLIQVDLSPPDMTRGIGDALRNLADGIFGGNRPLQIVGPANVNLTASAKAATYRILREALINAHKHSRAETVTLRIEQLDRMVVFSVSDDGDGAGDLAGPGHLGLATMRARAEAEGGQLHMQSTPGAGTTIVLTLPVTDGRVA